MLRVAGILLKTVDHSNLLLVLSVLVVLLPYGVCFSCFALKARSPVTQISLKLTVAQVGAELEILLPQPPKCWDCRSGPSQLAYWVFASLPGWDLEQSSLFSPSLPGLNPWCLDASCGLLLRVGLAARLAPHTVPTGSSSRVSVSPPQSALTPSSVTPSQGSLVCPRQSQANPAHSRPDASLPCDPEASQGQ